MNQTNEKQRNLDLGLIQAALYACMVDLEGQIDGRDEQYRRAVRTLLGVVERMLKDPAPPATEPDAEDLLKTARMYLISCRARIQQNDSSWYSGFRDFVDLLVSRKEQKPKQNPSHTAALEKLVEACGRLRLAFFPGSPLFDHILEPALKEARAALEAGK